MFRREATLNGKWNYVNSSGDDLGCNVFYQPATSLLNFLIVNSSNIGPFAIINVTSHLDIAPFINVKSFFVDSLCSKFYISSKIFRVNRNSSLDLIRDFV
jgi:hypothetical protein